MVPAPTTRDTSIGMISRVFRNVGNLCHFALAEENVDERLGLVGIQTLDEQLGLHLAAFFERKVGGRFHRVNGGERRDQAPLFLADAVAGSREDGRVVRGVPSF